MVIMFLPNTNICRRLNCLIPWCMLQKEHFHVPGTATYKSLLRTNCIPCSSALMKTKAARKFYMCHDELHEDYILWLKVLQKYGTAYGSGEPLLKFRLSQAGKSRNKLKSAKMNYGVYR